MQIGRLGRGARERARARRRSAAPVVPITPGVHPRGAEHRLEQVGRCGLAVRAGHAHQRHRGAGVPEHLGRHRPHRRADRADDHLRRRRRSSGRSTTSADRARRDRLRPRTRVRRPPRPGCRRRGCRPAPPGSRTRRRARGSADRRARPASTTAATSARRTRGKVASTGGEPTRLVAGSGSRQCVRREADGLAGLDAEPLDRVAAPRAGTAARRRRRRRSCRARRGSPTTTTRGRDAGRNPMNDAT